MVFPAEVPGDQLAWVPDAFFCVRVWDAFGFSVDPPDRPCQSEDEDAEGADLDDFSAQCVSVIEKWEVCGGKWEMGGGKWEDFSFDLI